MTTFIIPIIGLLITIVCSYISYADSESKNRKSLLFFTIVGAAITTCAAILSGIESKNSEIALLRWQKRNDSLSVKTHKYLTGNEAIPHIKFGPSKESLGGYSFYLCNHSKDVSLFDLQVRYIEVTADSDYLVFDAWAPQVAAEVAALQPSTLTELINAEPNEFKEGRAAAYNFFTITRGGYFREQMIIRLIGSQRKCVYRIYKDDSLVYTSPIPKEFYRPGEKAIVFPLPDEGLDKKLDHRYLKRFNVKPAEQVSHIRDISTVVGRWESQDSTKRFTLIFDGDTRICLFYERDKNGHELHSDGVIKYLPNGDIEVIRTNESIHTLEFLGFRPSLAKEILENDPEPSYLTLSFLDDEAIGKWKGISVRQNKDLSLREIVQPDDNVVKIYRFKKKISEE